MTAVRLADEIADLPLESRFPEGIWRVPIEMALALSTSVYVGKVRQRQAAGNYPYTDCVVFIRGKQFWALVDWPRGDGGNEPLQITFSLSLWPWENRDAPQPFGKREAPR